jgi:hypothetical protein
MPFRFAQPSGWEWSFATKSLTRIANAGYKSATYESMRFSRMRNASKICLDHGAFGADLPTKRLALAP